jgi:hypothetical protein
MADTQNTEVPPASQPAASVPSAAPTTVVRERTNWATPLIAALAVTGALVLGGVGGFALAAATHAGAHPAMLQGQLQGPGQQGPQMGGPRPGQPQQGPGGQQGDRPERPQGDTDDSEGSTDDEPTQEDSTEN